MKEKKDKYGRDIVQYEDIEEVKILSKNPPVFCSKCGEKLLHWSFFDSIGRFSLKATCPSCYASVFLPVNEEAYEERMLKRWADTVKKRAFYKCEMASPQCHGKLHAHHMIPKHADPHRKYDVSNGICLCEAHHKMIHSYM